MALFAAEDMMSGGWGYDELLCSYACIVYYFRDSLCDSLCETHFKSDHMPGGFDIMPRIRTYDLITRTTPYIEKKPSKYQNVCVGKK